LKLQVISLVCNDGGQKSFFNIFKSGLKLPAASRFSLESWIPRILNPLDVI
jgi:hypothetical protein